MWPLRRSGMEHTVSPPNNTMPVSTSLRSPDCATTHCGQTSNCSLLLIHRPPMDERQNWHGWLTYSRRFTHISGHPLALGRAEDTEGLLVKDRHSTAVLWGGGETGYPDSLGK